jgi:glyoxylase-like metal-dependent hydrolase (beta-lactamase superfamily II)
MRPRYFGSHLSPDVRPDFFGDDGAVRLPIGAFVVRGNGRTLLVDAGLGPDARQLPDGMSLIGGRLPAGLRRLGVTPDEVTDVVCTHLHADHVGWVFDTQAAPTFPGATVWFGASDWDAFVDGPGECAPHVRAGFGLLSGTSLLRPVRASTLVAPDVLARPTPGHTPGSIVVEVSSSRERLLLVGDAITCPIQLEEPAWHSFGDVDADAAARTRELLWDELGDGRTYGVGAHFPGLRPGSVSRGRPRSWHPVR